MKYRKFNINQHIKVKLTTFGKIIYTNHYSEFGIYKEIKTDNEGYTKFILWELMHIFGDCMVMGADMPFETNVLIEEKEND